MRERKQPEISDAGVVCAPASRRIFARWVGQREGERYRALPRNGSRAKSAGLEAECCEGSLIRPTRCCERRMPCSGPMTGCIGSSVRPDRVISSFGIWYRWCTDLAVRQPVVPPFITDSSTQRSKHLGCEAGLTFKAYATCSMAELTPPLVITVPLLVFNSTVAPQSTPHTAQKRFFLSRSHRGAWMRLALYMIDTADRRAGIVSSTVLHTWEFARLEFFGRSPSSSAVGHRDRSHPCRSHLDQPVAAALFLSSQWLTHSIRRVRRRDPETSCCACIRRRIVAPSVAWSRKSASCLGRTATHSRKPLYSSLPHSDRNA